jgi:hypothetical protein
MTSQKTVRMRNIEVPLSIQLAVGSGSSLPLRWRHYNVEAIIDFHYCASISLRKYL